MSPSYHPSSSRRAVQPLTTLTQLTTLHLPPTTHHPPPSPHHPPHHSAQASYEAVLLCAALDQAEAQGSGLAVLTFLGGGVFGNRPEWIEAAIARAVVRRPCHLIITPP